MKSKMNKIIPLLLLSVLLIPLAINNNAQAALVVSDPFIVGVDVVFEGYQPESMPAYSVVYNATIPTVSLQSVGFADENLAPNDFATTGITRTYSDSYLGSVLTPSSAHGIYLTLKGIQESAFSQLAMSQDTSVYTYSPLDTFYKTVNDTLYALDPDWQGYNFTCGDMYALISFDKVLMDQFFADAKAKSTFDDIATEYSTNQQLITTLLDDVFGATILDIIYAPINVSTYPDDWTVAQEVRSVLGGNATDTSLLGPTKIVSVRNAFFGYVGERIAPTSVVGNALRAVTPESQSDAIFGFAQTATTYTIKFRIKADYIASPLSEDLSLVLALLQPADIAAAIQVFQVLWLENILWSLLAGVGLGITGFAVFYKKKKVRTIAGVGGFLFGFIICLVILMFATVTI